MTTDPGGHAGGDLGGAVTGRHVEVDAQERLDRADVAYEMATFGGSIDAVSTGEAELDHVEARLALARGRLLHARFLRSGTRDDDELVLFTRATELFARCEDVQGEGESTFWLATYHQTVLGDHAAAEPLLHRAERLAAAAGDRLTTSYVLRHLAFVDLDAGRPVEARTRLEESTRIRRGLGFTAGVAANLVGLAYLAAELGDGDDPLTILDEARELALAVDAGAILEQVETARAQVGGPRDDD